MHTQYSNLRLRVKLEQLCPNCLFLISLEKYTYFIVNSIDIVLGFILLLV